MEKINIGILGTAHITTGTVLIPGRHSKIINVAAVASRDLNRAKSYAQKNHIPKFYGNYDELIQDPNIDVIYNPLPNSMHKEWSIKALKAGKSVLCEKPIAANAENAMEMKQVADETGLLLMEGFHNLYHPISRWIKEIFDSQELGTIKQMDFKFLIGISRNNIRFKPDLAGGSLMDLGCYGVNLFRYLCQEEPIILSATAKCQDPQIDDEITAELQFPNLNITGTINCSMVAKHYEQKLRIIGTEVKWKCLDPLIRFFISGSRLKREILREKLAFLALSLGYIKYERCRCIKD